jgi:hypothetical protein
MMDNTSAFIYGLLLGAMLYAALLLLHRWLARRFGGGCPVCERDYVVNQQLDQSDLAIHKALFSPKPYVRMAAGLPPEMISRLCECGCGCSIEIRGFRGQELSPVCSPCRVNHQKPYMTVDVDLEPGVYDVQLPTITRKDKYCVNPAVHPQPCQVCGPVSDCAPCAAGPGDAPPSGRTG